MNLFYKIALIILIIGGINWGLIGFFSFDLVAWIFGGSSSILARIIYSLVGLSALCAIPSLFSSCSSQNSDE